MIKVSRGGANRYVVLVGGYALKFPRIANRNGRLSWRTFLFALLNNDFERRLGTSGQAEFCPVVFALPLGLLVVQRRAREMTEAEYWEFDVERFCQPAVGYEVPSERKASSFGWLGDRPVCIDYGWPA